MYAAPLKACEWSNTQVVDNVKHVTLPVFLVIKTTFSSVIVYQSQGHVCVHFILWFQWNERD